MGLKFIFDLTEHKYYHEIYRYCIHRLCDKYAAEDCVQEVFFLLYKKLNGNDIPENIRAWLYSTADRLIKNHCKNKKHDISLDGNEADTDAFFYYDSYNEDEPFSGILSREELELITAHYKYGEDIRSLSERLGKSRDAVYKRLQRIKKKIREYIDISNNNGR